MPTTKCGLLDDDANERFIIVTTLLFLKSHNASDKILLSLLSLTRLVRANRDNLFIQLFIFNCQF